MSSTGRGMARHPDDFYATPAWAVDAVLPHLGPLGDRWILEPSAGEGAIARRLIAAGALPERITAVEFDAERADACRLSCPATYHRDFLTFTPPISAARNTGLIVMNPPFTLAQEFVERALSHWLAPGGTCAALLRLAFACSKKRAAFRKAHPFDLLALASRPSFGLNKDGKPGTDSADYGWFLYGDKHGGRFSVLEASKLAA